MKWASKISTINLLCRKKENSSSTCVDDEGEREKNMNRYMIAEVDYDSNEK